MYSPSQLFALGPGAAPKKKASWQCAGAGSVALCQPVQTSDSGLYLPLDRVPDSGLSCHL